MTPELTPARLLTKAYEQIAFEGNNCGPDDEGTQMLALYQDIQVSTDNDNVLRVEELLNKATNAYGI
jgi:hypothetical protein